MSVVAVDAPSSSPVCALQAEGVCVGYGAQQVLHEASLQAQAGEWLSIVGPNGAGKSTLLRCLAGLMPVPRGQVSLRGQPLAQWPSRLRARTVAWLGQDVAGDPAMSVYDTVALGRLPYQGWLGLRGMTAGDHDAVKQALVDTDMAWAASRPMAALSGGERQRVNLARALAVRAAIMLLDEPVSHLDAPHQRLLAQVMRREASQGVCVISVLHELPLALAADKLAVMQAGRVIASGGRDDPMVHRAVEQVFDQAVSISQVNGRWTALPTYE